MSSDWERLRSPLSLSRKLTNSVYNIALHTLERDVVHRVAGTASFKIIPVIVHGVAKSIYRCCPMLIAKGGV